jgi:hypothetical protein
MLQAPTRTEHRLGLAAELVDGEAAVPGELVLVGLGFADLQVALGDHLVGEGRHRLVRRATGEDLDRRSADP